MEEVEWIQTTHPVFTLYLSIVEAMLAHQSNNLYVGPVLHSLQDTALLKRRTSQVRHLQVANYHAATMFFLNIQSWKHQPFIQAHYASQQIEQLQNDLHALTLATHSCSEIAWGMRQMVFARV
jgi:hypothetical protein